MFDFSKKKIIITIALLPIFLEEFWVLELIRILVEYVLTCKIRFEYGWVWTWKCLNPERKSCEFKNIRVNVDGARGLRRVSIGLITMIIL